MRAIGIIAGLTVREALRRRLFVLSLAVALIFFLLSLLPLAMGHADTVVGPRRAPLTLPVAICIFLGFPMLRFFASLEAILLATGGLAGEIERGSLLVVLPRPITRAQVLLGKWLGVNLVCALSVAVWALLFWASLFIQRGYPYGQLLRAAAMVLLYPVVFSSLALLFASFAGATLASALTVLLGAIAWSEGILKVIGGLPIVQEPLLVRIGDACAWVVPMAAIDRWVDRMLGILSPTLLALRLGRPPEHAATTGDLVYTAAYAIAALVVALLIFQKRDV